MRYRRTVDALIVMNDNNEPIYGFRLKGGLYGARGGKDKNYYIGTSRSKGIGFEVTQIIYNGSNQPLP